MQIAFVSTEDPRSKDSFSGSSFQLVAALERAGASVRTLGPIAYYPSRLERLKVWFHAIFGGHTYEPSWSRHAVAYYARSVSARLAQAPADVVLSRGTHPIASLKTKQPIYLWQDATFKQLLEDYPGFRQLPAGNVSNGHAVERQAFTRCRRLIFTSAWASRSAVQDYAMPPDRVSTILIGANRSSGWDDLQARTIIEGKSFDVCRLLFIGVDWHRKGGDGFLRLVNTLSKRGINVKATAVGDWPTRATLVPENVSCIGSLPHSSPEGTARLQRLLTEAHFLVLPTRADCSPVVVAEAASYGLPVICTPVGGLPEMVNSDSTGFIGEFDSDASLASLAEKIARSVRAPAEWRSLAWTSFQRGKTSLNWDAHARQLLALIKTDLAR
jgi:glycosyltransferase involved in cell wall biosynthesis